MNVLHHLFPFDMAPGPGFMLVYLVIAIALFVAAVARNAIGRSLDRTAAKACAPVPTPTGGYRVPAPGPELALGIGRLPRGVERWAVAYLRAGRTSLADGLTAGAFARNLVYPDASKQLYVGPPARRSGSTTC